MNRKGQYFTTLFWAFISFLVVILIISPMMKSASIVNSANGISGLPAMLVSIFGLLLLAIIFIYLISGTGGQR